MCVHITDNCPKIIQLLEASTSKSSGGHILRTIILQKMLRKFLRTIGAIQKEVKPSYIVLFKHTGQIWHELMTNTVYLYLSFVKKLICVKNGI